MEEDKQIAVQQAVQGLQQKIDTNSFNPREYNKDQLNFIGNLINEGVIKSAPLKDVVGNFEKQAKQLATEKEFNISPIAFATKDKSIFRGELSALIPTREGASMIADFAASVGTYAANKDLLMNALQMPKGAQTNLIASKANQLADAIEKVPGIGKKMKFTRGVLKAGATSADNVLKGRILPIAAVEAGSVVAGATAGAAAVPVYDFFERNFGKDIAVAINSDLANIPEQEVQSNTLTAGIEYWKNSMLWGGGAAAMMPLLKLAGKSFYSALGAKGEKGLELSEFAAKNNLPIPFIAGIDPSKGFGPLGTLSQTFFKTIGIYPGISKIGDQAIRNAEEQAGKYGLFKAIEGLAPLTKTAQVAAGSYDLFRQRFAKNMSIVGSIYENLYKVADDLGNPNAVKLSRTREAAKDFLTEIRNFYPPGTMELLAGSRTSAQKAIEKLSLEGDPLIRIYDFISSIPEKEALNFKQYSYLNRMIAEASKQTSMFDVRKSLFVLRDALETDLNFGMGRVTKQQLLESPIVKAEYDRVLATGGEKAAKDLIDDKLAKIQKLNGQLEEANTAYSTVLRFFTTPTAKALSKVDNSMFTKNSLLGVVDAPAHAEKVFDTIENSVFKSRSPQAIEELKGLYGYGASKEGTEMFNRAVGAHVFKSYYSSFKQREQPLKGVMRVVDEFLGKEPNANPLTIYRQVGAKQGLQEYQDLTSFGYKEVLDNKGNVNLNMTFGKDDYAIFDANMFAEKIGLIGSRSDLDAGAEVLFRSFGGGKTASKVANETAAQAVKDIAGFVNYSKALQDVPISETSTFVQRRISLGGIGAIVGSFAAGAGTLGLLPTMALFYVGYNVGKALADPKALRYLMDVLTPAERKAIAEKATGVKKAFGTIPVTYGESQLRAFARFANYMAEDDVTLPKVDPKNINPDEIIARLQNRATGPVKGFNYKNLPKKEKETMFPEIVARENSGPVYNLTAEDVTKAYRGGKEQALTALNQDYGVGQPAQTAMREEQAQQTTGSPIQPPRIQPVTPPQATQQDSTRQQYANLNPFDIVSPLIKAQG